MIEYIHISKIRLLSIQPRKRLLNTKNIEASIKRNNFRGSLIGTPDFVKEPGTIELLDGSRRFTAAKNVGLTHLPIDITRFNTNYEKIKTFIDLNDEVMLQFRDSHSFESVALATEEEQFIIKRCMEESKSLKRTSESIDTIREIYGNQKTNELGMIGITPNSFVEKINKVHKWISHYNNDKEPQDQYDIPKIQIGNWILNNKKAKTEISNLTKLADMVINMGIDSEEYADRVRRLMNCIEQNKPPGTKHLRKQKCKYL